MNRRLCILCIIIILFFCIAPHLFAQYGLAISSPTDSEILSGLFSINGTLADTTGVEAVCVKTGDGPWEKAEGISTWSYEVNYRQIVLGTEYRFEPVINRFIRITKRGPCYGDITLKTGIFDAFGNLLSEESVIVTIIPEPPISNVPAGWYNEDVNLTFTTKPECSIYYTLDDSDPSVSGILYTNSILLTESTLVKAVSLSENFYYSDIIELDINIDTLAPPSFSIQYFADSGLTVSSGDNPQINEGTYYIRITASKQLISNPTITVNAEGTSNDVTDASTIFVTGNVYYYERTIANDPAATGSTPEDISITGSDMTGNDSIDVDPVNEALKVAYTDTIDPATGSISIQNVAGYTNDPTPELTLSSTGASNMRFALSEENLSLATWVPFASLYDGFDISPGGYGNKTVWVEYRDIAGNIQGIHTNAQVYYDSSALSFDIQYYADSGRTISLGDNPPLRVGTYYIEIIPNKSPGTNPQININAEGTANDVTAGNTVQVDVDIYMYTRTITYDALALGIVLEGITIEGISPSNEFTKAAYTDTVTPVAPVVTGTSPTNNTTPTWDWDDVSGATLYCYGYTEGTWITETETISEFTPGSGLSDGDYTLYVQAGDDAGNWSASGSFGIHIDATPPDPPVVTGITPTNTTTPTWDWDDVPDAAKYRYGYSEGTWITETETVSEFTPPAPLTPASYSLYVQAGDDLDNWSESGSFIITIDIIPPNSPVVTGITPTNNTTPTWDWDDVVDAAMYRYGYTEGTWITETATVSDYTPSSSLSEDSHGLYVQAQDDAGNWSLSGYFAIIIDITPPGIPVVTGTTPTNNPTPTWDWNDVADATRYRYGFTEGTWITETATVSDYTPGSPLTPDSYTLFVQSGDNAGNWSVSGSFTIVVDTDIPGTPSVIGTTPTNNTTPAWDWDDVVNATKYRYGYSEGTWITETATLSEYTPPAPLSEGPHTLYVQAGDDANNWSGSGNFTILIDISPPIVDVGTDISWTNTQAGLDATVTDATALTYLWEKTNGTGTVIFTDDSACDTLIEGIDNEEEVFTLQLTATDGAGNSASGTLLFSWDRKGPEVNAGSDISWTNTQGVISGSATDLNTISSYLWEDITGSGQSEHNEGFESGSFETGWAASGNVPWFIQSSTVNTGIYAAESGNITHNEQSILEFTYDVPVSGDVSFYYRVSSESNYDFLRFYIDDVQQSGASWSGTISWTGATYPVSAGNRTFKWVYSKDGSEDSGSDCAWIDDVTLPGISSSASFGNPSLASTTIAGTPGLEETYTIQLTATDALGNPGTDTLLFYWDSLAPVVDAGLDISWTNSIQSLDATVTATGSPILSTSWEQPGGTGTVIFGNTGIIDTTVRGTTGEEESFTLRLTAADSAGNSTVDILYFEWDSKAPEVNAGNDISLTNSQEALDATVTDLTSLTYLWERTGGTGTVLFADANACDTTIEGFDGEEAVFTIQLMATDIAGNSASDTLFFDWDKNAPSVDAGSDIPLTNLEQPIAGSATDLNDITGYLWESSGGVIFGDETAASTTVTGPDDAEDTYTLRLNVTDGAGNIGFDELLFYWDKMAPTVILSGTPPDPSTSANIDIEITNPDVVTYQYKLDTGSWSTDIDASTHIVETSLSESTHTLLVRGRDQAGNWQMEADATEYTWTIDITPPDPPDPDAYDMYDWHWVNPVPAGGTFNEIIFIDEMTGWIVGNAGTVLYTTDGGESWTKQEIGVENDLEDVIFIDADHGWACGVSGTVISTQDSGLHWTVQTTPTTSTIYSIFFIDENIGWASGASGRIFGTTDGGNTWNQLTSGVSSTLYSICFTDQNTGWAAGSSGIIVKTTNGGASWEELTSGTTNTLNDICFVDSLFGWAAGSYGTILKTIDGGINWTIPTTGTSETLYDVSFIDQNKGWLCGRDGKTGYTVDGGDIWYFQEIPDGSNLNSIFFVNQDKGWIAGDGNDLLCLSTDGGKTWSREIESSEDDYLSIEFLDANNGFIGMYGGLLYKTTDQCNTMTQVYDGIRDFKDITFTDTNNGYAVGNYGEIIRTTNGGDDWQDIDSGTSSTLNSVSFANSNNGWAVGNSGTIINTIDGGQTWAEQTSGVSTTLYGVFFITSQMGWTVGSSGTILHTSDGGTTWTTQTSGTSNTLYAVFFVDENTGWLGGSFGRLMKTVDGGTNWTSTSTGTSETIYKLYFQNAQIGWAMTSAGVYATTDGCDSYTPQAKLVTSQLNDFAVIDSQTIIAVGDNNTILKKYADPLAALQTTTEDVSVIITGEQGVTLNKSATKNSIPCSWPTDDVFIESGVYDLSITQTDGAGNESLPAAISFTIEPEYTIQYYADAGFSNSLGNNPTFTNGTYYLKITANRSPLATPDITIDAEGIVNDVAGVPVTYVSELVYRYTRTISIDGTATGTIRETISLSGREPENGDTRGAFIDFEQPAAPVIQPYTDHVWQQVNPDPSGDTLNSIHFINSTTGWAVGTGGVIIHTTDSGATWNPQESPVYNELRGVYFVNPAHGWAAGISGTVVRTVDGGGTWEEWSPETTRNMNALFFIDSDTGWVVGQYGDIFKTINGGYYWTEQTAPSQYLTGIIFIDANTGWVSGYNGTILYTSDGGDTWGTQTSTTSEDLTSIYFVDASNGWACGDAGTIVATIDGGTTWTAQTSGITDDLYAIQFADILTGWAFGESGQILHTTDGGATWGTQTSGTSEYLYASSFIDASSAYVAGSSGCILSTTDGGSNWNLLTSGYTEHLESVSFGDAQNGWACGYEGRVLHTADGGTTWNTQLSGSLWLHSIYFIDANNGWACGDAGIIRHTTNGGTNWGSQTSGTANILYSIYFLDANNGWAAASNGRVLRTTNGGSSWSSYSTGTTYALYSVHFTDANTGWAVGLAGVVRHTTNGGTSWTSVDLGTDTFNSVFFIDSLTGWIVGEDGLLLKTTDGGTNWYPLDTGATDWLTSVSFTDSQHGYITGNSGIILYTTDGGTSWERQVSYTGTNLNSCAITGTGGAFTGDSGTILHYNPILQLIDTDTVSDDVIVSFITESGATIVSSATKDSIPYSWPDEDLFSENGTYVITASQEDAAGNESSNATFTFTINK